MTVDELRASLDSLSDRGFGGATVVIVRDGKEVTWQPEGGVWPALVAPDCNCLIDFGDVGNEEADLTAEGDARELVVAVA